MSRKFASVLLSEALASTAFTNGIFFRSYSSLLTSFKTGTGSVFSAAQSRLVLAPD